MGNGRVVFRHEARKADNGSCDLNENDQKLIRDEHFHEDEGCF